jgi:hypothetical protein
MVSDFSVKLDRGSCHARSVYFALAGLALSTKWEFEDENTFTVVEINERKDSTPNSLTVRKPELVFSNGKSYTGEQFYKAVCEGDIQPENPSAVSLAVELGHPQA